MKYLAFFLLFIVQLAQAEPRQIDEYRWADVDRIIAIGDIHGDYEHYMAALKAAGLVNDRGKWTGGETHLVQTGDIPDRGPDTRKIIGHLAKLTKEARKKGGMVHSLIGNHEAMNVYGDLRYVSPGEYEAFADRNSKNLRDRYFDLSMQDLQKRDPEAFAALPENFRETWDKEHPLGWVEHRQAWDPAWNPEGELAQWVLGRQVAVQLNDLIFVHGGISGFYCQNSLQSLTDKVLGGLRAYDPKNPGILEDEFGPLWYRGLSGEQPAAAPETVQAILDQHDAHHIVVGHTPTSGAIWPRYLGRVIQIDTGISKIYGGYVAYLEANKEGLFAGYPKGRIKLPLDEAGLVPYLEQVIALDPENSHLRNMLAELTAPPAETTAGEGPMVEANQGEMATDPGADGTEPGGAEPATSAAMTVPICGISG
jgi:Calcineurin-like phosphoesterase